MAYSDSGNGSASGRRKFMKAAGAATLFGLAGCSGGGSDDGGDTPSDGSNTGTATGTPGGINEDITLTFSTILPENHRLHQNGGKYWMDQVTERSGGKIQWDVHTGAELGGGDQHITLLKNGIIDAGMISASQNSDILPFISIPILPGATGDTKKASATWVEEFLQDETIRSAQRDKGFVASCCVMTTPYKLALKNEKATSLDDIEGQSFKTQGGVETMIVEALGATPVELSAAENYTALQRGTVTGLITTLGSLTSFNYAELISWYAQNTPMGFAPIHYMMSSESYDGLPAEAQTILDEAGLDAANHYAEWTTSQSSNIRENAKDMGTQFYDYPDWEPVSQMLVDEVHPKWLQTRPEEIRDTASELADKWVASFS